jgi:hypothetical protein
VRFFFASPNYQRPQICISRIFDLTVQAGPYCGWSLVLVRHAKIANHLRLHSDSILPRRFQLLLSFSCAVYKSRHNHVRHTVVGPSDSDSANAHRSMFGQLCRTIVLNFVSTPRSRRHRYNKAFRFSMAASRTRSSSDFRCISGYRLQTPSEWVAHDRGVNFMNSDTLTGYEHTEM